MLYSAPRTLYFLKLILITLDPARSKPVSAFASLVQPEAPGTLQLPYSNWLDEPRLDRNCHHTGLAINVYEYSRLPGMVRPAHLAPIRLGEI